MRLLVLVVIIACGNNARPLTRGPTPASRPIDARAESELERMSRWPVAFATPDGATVLLPVVDASQAQSWFAFEVRDRADRIQRTVDVLSLDAMSDATINAERMADVARSIATRPFVRVAPLAADPQSDVWDHQRFTRDGIIIDWQDDRLAISRESKLVLDRRIPATWHAVPYWLPSARVTCTNEPFLRAAYATANVVVIDVGYHGNDTCEEPAGQLHVVGA